MASVLVLTLSFEMTRAEELVSFESDSYTTVVEDQRVEEVSKRSLKREQLQNTVGNQGDPIRILQDLPGVARSSFGSGQLSVRGSAPFESRVYLDDLEVPILFHFGGLRTVYPAEWIESIQFLPGGFSSRYGNAVGGIVNSTTRKPKEDRFHLLVDINLFDSQLWIEGPLHKEWSFLAGARRSYIDLVLRSLFKNRSGFAFLTAPRYYDYQTELHWHPKSNDRRYLQIFGSDDEVSFLLDKPNDRDPTLRGNFSNKTSFHRMNLHWDRDYAKGWATRLKMGIGANRFTFDTSNGPFLKIYSDQFTWRHEVTKQLLDELSMTVGTDGMVSQYRVSAKVPPPAINGGVFNPLATTSLVETTQRGIWAQGGTFSAMNWKPGLWTVTPGIRLDAGTTGGDLTLDPRLSVKRQIHEQNLVKASLGLYHQRPQPQETADDVGNPDLTGKYAIQYTAGYEHEFLGPIFLQDFAPFSWDIQGFYRDLHRQIVPSGTAQRYSNDGEGYSIGMENYFKWGSTESFHGWVSYTLSRSRLREKADQPDHPVTYDQTHILSLLGTYPFASSASGLWAFGFRWRYVTGGPYTPVIDSMYSANADTYMPLRGALYSERFPDFHQLDLRLERKWFFPSWKLTAYIEVNNVYNRRNVEAMSYAYDYRAKEFITGLPLIPYFGLKGEF